jgi:hypothetical protein
MNSAAGLTSMGTRRFEIQRFREGNEPLVERPISAHLAGAKRIHTCSVKNGRVNRRRCGADITSRHYAIAFGEEFVRTWRCGFGGLYDWF